MCTVLSYGVIGSAAIQLTKEPPALETQVIICGESMQNSSFLLYLSKFSRFYKTAVVVHRFTFTVKWKTLQNKKRVQ